MQVVGGVGERARRRRCEHGDVEHPGGGHEVGGGTVSDPAGEDIDDVVDVVDTVSLVAPASVRQVFRRTLGIKPAHEGVPIALEGEEDVAIGAGEDTKGIVPMQAPLPDSHGAIGGGAGEDLDALDAANEGSAFDSGTD